MNFAHDTGMHVVFRMVPWNSTLYLLQFGGPCVERGTCEMATLGRLLKGYWSHLTMTVFRRKSVRSAME